MKRNSDLTPEERREWFDMLLEDDVTFKHINNACTKWKVSRRKEEKEWSVVTPIIPRRFGAAVAAQGGA